MKDLRSSLGQMFFVGFDGTADSESLRDYLSEIRPGGVILFTRNIIEPAQVQTLNQAMIASGGNIAPFISIDQEGGRVSRLRPLLPPLPTAADLGRLDGARIRAYARVLGEVLAALGFNTDFAPVVDLSSPGAPNGIGDRSFGEDAARVSLCARSFIDGLREAGIASFLKHFPGLGATDLDSHLALPVCSRSESDLWERDLLPFRECGDEAAGVMIAHVHCPPFDPGEAVPASLSQAVVTGLLRERMGYNGISLTDDLGMGAVLGPSPEELARRSLLAGNDMVMFCNSEEQARAAFRGLLDDVGAGRLEERRIDRSVERVLAAKKRFGIDARRAGRTTPPWEATLSALSSYAVA